MAWNRDGSALSELMSDEFFLIQHEIQLVDGDYRREKNQCIVEGKSFASHSGGLF